MFEMRGKFPALVFAIDIFMLSAAINEEGRKEGEKDVLNLLFSPPETSPKMNWSGKNVSYFFSDFYTPANIDFCCSIEIFDLIRFIA